jgi:galactokinase/mevalonate kinase-like predicted kinase
MLRSESGDILSELERKMQMLIDNHAQEKQEIEKERQKERDDAASDAKRRLQELRDDYER